MTRSELRRCLYQLEEKINKARAKRTRITIALFSLAFFAILVSMERPSGHDILYALIASIVMGAIHFYVNAVVFSILNTKSQEENDAINAIKRKILELDGVSPDEPYPDDYL